MVDELGSEMFEHMLVERVKRELHEPVDRAPSKTTVDDGGRVSVAFDGPLHVFDAAGEPLGD